VIGFEPTTSWSQTKRTSQAVLHPDGQLILGEASVIGETRSRRNRYEMLDDEVDHGFAAVPVTKDEFRRRLAARHRQSRR
jgi:hypothetical protein